jgi:HEPN domain-containing protein
MSHEHADVRTLEVRGWLPRASEDLRAGKHDLNALPPLLNDVAFHSQQCTEKAIKAFLVHREQAFRKTHNLTELGGMVARQVPELADLMREASLITEFAWRFRYPGSPVSVARADALRALDTAKRVLAAVMKALPANCRSE